MKKINREVVRQNRAKLLKVFADLRKEGFIARANHLCCQNCAGYDLAERVSKMPPEKAKKIKGVVFWHNQDEQDIWDNGHVFLAYRDMDTEGHGRIGMPTKVVGTHIVAGIEKAGLKCDWNGDPAQRIWIDLNEQKIEKIC